MSESGTVAGGAGAISWTAAGSGRPLLLINGYAATAADWDPGFVAALAGFARVICPDNRGMGGSAGEPGAITIEAMAADVIALLDRLGIESADVAGWSMGGFIAQEVAATAPARVERIVLLATDPGGGDALLAGRDSWHALTDHSGTPEEQARRLVDLLFPPPLAASIFEQFGDVVAAARAALDPAILTAQERVMKDWHREAAGDRLEAIASPALIAAGSEDAVIPAGNSELLASALGDSWLARFPGCGHAFMAQEPERAAALIAAFLAR